MRFLALILLSLVAFAAHAHAITPSASGVYMDATGWCWVERYEAHSGQQVLWLSCMRSYGDIGLASVTGSGWAAPTGVLLLRPQPGPLQTWGTVYIDALSPTSMTVRFDSGPPRTLLRQPLSGFAADRKR
jgi:hypothetical protein